MAMQNRASNVTMAKYNKNALETFPETATWRSLRPIDTTAVEPQNGFSVARVTTVPDNSEMQITVKHDFSETFDRENIVGKQLAKVSCIILFLVCENFSLTMSLTFFFIFIYFT